MPGGARILWIAGLLLAGPAQAQLAELLWIDNSRQQGQLFYSALSNDEWAPPQRIYLSDKPLSSPAITTDSNGNKLVIWSEASRDKSNLMRLYKLADAANWSRAALFSNYGSENLSTDIVVDLADNFWVFWSATRDSYDDIVYSTGDGSTWSDPQTVHPANDVPDILPEARLNESGDIELSWRSYSLAARQYISAFHVFELENDAKSSYKLPLDGEQDIARGNVILPAYLPDSSAAVLHFPDNVLKRSERLNSGQ